MGGNSIFVRILDTDGDGTGTENAIGDYSLTSTDFFIEPPAKVEYELSHILFSIRDGVGAAAEKYGAIAGGITNGLQILITRGATTVRDFTNGVPIKTNTDFTRYTHNVLLHEWGAGDEVLSVDWAMHGADEHIHLHGDKSDKLIIRLNDDFTGLVSQYFSVQGLVRSFN